MPALLMVMLVGLFDVVAPARVSAAPAGDDQVVAFEVRGVGNGHGRGMSQWGAFGRAVDGGQTWEQILDEYYGGTHAGHRTQTDFRVRLTGWDGAATVGVVSTTGTAEWGIETGYSSLYAIEISPDRFSVFGSAQLACPGGATLVIPFGELALGDQGVEVEQMQRFLKQYGPTDPQYVDGDFGLLTEQAVIDFQVDVGLADDGVWAAEEAAEAQAIVDDDEQAITWDELATDIAGPITFGTSVDASSSAPNEVLGLCDASGFVTHYRGTIEVRDVSGLGHINRVVNEIDVEDYLRGVVPKEVSASWGAAGDGAGMHALRAQAVAARSFAISQNRYSYAKTCDTSSCQVYGGAAKRASATAGGWSSVEQTNTNAAIALTDEVVREWPDGTIVSTEFSASNGPNTAGGAFPSVADPYDDVPGNPNHRWTRVIDADDVIAQYGLANANDVITVPDLGSPYVGIWANEVQLGNGAAVSAWDFRNDFGLPAPGFELVPIRRTISSPSTFAFIGDSVGVSVASSPTSSLPVLLEGVFAATGFDVLGARPTQGGGETDGVAAANDVPVGTDLVVVELGYNDAPSAMPDRIDALMAALRSRDVGLVVWVGPSERRPEYLATNIALRAATERWDELIFWDWHAASSSAIADRWFADDVHLMSTGRAEFSIWLRDHIIDVAGEGYVPPRPLGAGEVLRVPVSGVGGVPGSGVAGVSLNVTAVSPVGPGCLVLGPMMVVRVRCVFGRWWRPMWWWMCRRGSRRVSNRPRLG